jgi:hypothetical protein
MNRILIVLLTYFIFPLGAYSQEKDMAEMYRMMAEIQQSHIEANVPTSTEFDAYLKRDLKRYFESEGKAIEVQYELLRDGPTQSGVSYPKYYIWAKVLSGEKIIKHGAIRLAAIEKKRFEVFGFLSKSEINKSPAEAAKIFPRMLLSRIYELADVK